MNTLKRFCAVTVACSAIFALSGCSKPPVIGVLLPSTGAASAYATSMKNAIDLALADAEEANEIPAGLTVVWGDSATDPETAASEFRRLVSEGAKIVVAGTTSGEAKALLPVIEDTNTICLSPSATLPSLTKDSKLFYRVFSSDELEGRRAARFLREDQGKDSVVIFTEDSEQARGIEPPFRQVFEQTMSGEVMGRIVLTEPDWEQAAADLCLGNHPDSAYVIAYTEKTLEVLHMLRSREFDGTVCVTSAFYGGDVVTQHSDIVDGIYFPQPAFDTRDERPLVQGFVTAYKNRYGLDPDIYAAHAYDAIRVVLKTISETDIVETSELRKTMQFGLDEFPGVTGIIQFNDYGDVHHNPIMFIVKDGEVRNYEIYLKEEKKKIRDRIKRLLGT